MDKLVDRKNKIAKELCDWEIRKIQLKSGQSSWAGIADQRIRELSAEWWRINHEIKHESSEFKYGRDERFMRW